MSVHSRSNAGEYWGNVCTFRAIAGRDAPTHSPRVQKIGIVDVHDGSVASVWTFEVYIPVEDDENIQNANENTPEVQCKTSKSSSLSLVPLNIVQRAPG